MQIRLRLPYGCQLAPGTPPSLKAKCHRSQMGGLGRRCLQVSARRGRLLNRGRDHGTHLGASQAFREVYALTQIADLRWRLHVDDESMDDRGAYASRAVVSKLRRPWPPAYRPTRRHNVLRRARTRKSGLRSCGGGNRLQRTSRTPRA